MRFIQSIFTHIKPPSPHRITVLVFTIFLAILCFFPHKHLNCDLTKILKRKLLNRSINRPRVLRLATQFYL